MLQETDFPELKTTSQMVEAYPELCKRSTLHFYGKNRDTNGLAEIGAVFRGPLRKLVWHESRFINWLLGTQK